MIFDKCGGMAVLGLMYAVAKLKLPIHVVGILSSAENAISGKAYRPGDILHMYNGVTVEVTNTDAEGRLVLGDALAWGIETYQARGGGRSGDAHRRRGHRARHDDGRRDEQQR